MGVDTSTLTTAHPTFNQTTQAAKELADAYKSTFHSVRDEMARDTDDGKVWRACCVIFHPPS